MAEWKDTLNLPRTGFPMKANLQTAEPQALARPGSTVPPELLPRSVAAKTTPSSRKCPASSGIATRAAAARIRRHRRRGIKPLVIVFIGVIGLLGYALLCTALAGITGYLYTSRQPLVYQSRSRSGSITLSSSRRSSAKSQPTSAACASSRAS